MISTTRALINSWTAEEITLFKSLMQCCAADIVITAALHENLATVKQQALAIAEVTL